MVETFTRQDTRPEFSDSTTNVYTPDWDLQEIFGRIDFSPTPETTEEEALSNYQPSSLFINEILVLPEVFFDGDLTAVSSISPDPTNSTSPSEESDDSDESDSQDDDSRPEQMFAPHDEDAPYTEHPRDRRHCRHLTPEQRVARSSAAVSRLNREQIQSISAVEIASIAPLLSPDQIRSLTRNQIRQLPIIGINLLRSMSTDQLAELTQQQMLMVRYMMPSLPVGIISAFTPEQLGTAANSRIAAEQEEAQRLRSIQRNAMFGHQGVYT